jgi:hypothetical protein
MSMPDTPLADPLAPADAPVADPQMELLRQIAGSLAALQAAAPAAPAAPAAAAPTAPEAPAPPEPLPAPGTLALYTQFDSYARPARDRTQVVLVTAHEDDGDGGQRARGFTLGYAEDAAQFLPGQLAPAG